MRRKACSHRPSPKDESSLGVRIKAFRKIAGAEQKQIENVNSAAGNAETKDNVQNEKYCLRPHLDILSPNALSV
jgi:hypothetical protein